jgi:hypothetical protein
VYTVPTGSLFAVVHVLLPGRLPLLPSRGRQQVPLKCWSISTRLQDITSQKTRDFKGIQVVQMGEFPMACTEREYVLTNTVTWKLYLTRERAFISVCLDVCLQICALYKALFTECALEWPLPRMNAHVIPPGTAIRKAHLTVVAHERFLLHTGFRLSYHSVQRAYQLITPILPNSVCNTSNRPTLLITGTEWILT